MKEQTVGQARWQRRVGLHKANDCEETGFSGAGYPIALHAQHAAFIMHIQIERGNFIHLVDEPYPQKIVATPSQGLSEACLRWLKSTTLFSVPLARPEIAGVRGRLAEHLARMVSASRQMELAVWDVWHIMQLRYYAKLWSDAVTVRYLDSVIEASVFFETFAPQIHTRMTFARQGPVSEWWIEGAPCKEFPTPLAVRGPVINALRRALAKRYEVEPINIVPDVRGWTGQELTDAVPMFEGHYQFKLQFGAGAGSSIKGV